VTTKLNEGRGLTEEGGRRSIGKEKETERENEGLRELLKELDR